MSMHLFDLKQEKKIKLNAKPWLSNGILKSIQTKNALFKKCYKKNDPVLIENYKKYSNKLTSIKRIAKQNYYAHMIQLNKNDLSKQWRSINQILERNNKPKASITKLINIGGQYRGTKVPRYRYRGTFLVPVPVPSVLLWYRYRQKIAKYRGTVPVLQFFLFFKKINVLQFLKKRTDFKNVPLKT